MVHEKAPPSSRPKGGGWEKEDAKWITLDWREKGGWLMVDAVVPTPLKEEREEGREACRRQNGDWTSTSPVGKVS